MTIRALGAVVAVVLAAGCTGGGGGGGGEDEPPAFEQGAMSADGAPACTPLAWCDVEDLINVSSEDGITVCLTTFDSIKPGTATACVEGGAQLDGICFERATETAPGGRRLWSANVFGSDITIESTDPNLDEPWKVTCREGAQWASEVVRDGRLYIYNEDGTLFSNNPVTR